MATIFTSHAEPVPCGDCRGENRATTACVLGDDVGRCSFCGERHATAFWQDWRTVSCCRRCAVEVLPKLMADAVVGEHGSQPGMVGTVRRYLDLATATFWQAAATAIHRTGRNRR